jgi:hypothetical protein
MRCQRGPIGLYNFHLPRFVYILNYLAIVHHAQNLNLCYPKKNTFVMLKWSSQPSLSLDIA